MRKEKCVQCKKWYPDYLINCGDICPICALHNRNRIHRLPMDTPFQGEIAASMYDEAVAIYIREDNDE